MATIKLKSEIRIKSVNSIADGNEGQGSLFSEGDIVYSTADNSFKKRNSSGYDSGNATAAWDTVGGGSGGIANVVDDGTPQLGGDLDGQAYNITTTGKILYANVYTNESDLPSASTYHGMFAHVHSTGKGYFAHGGNWIKLEKETAYTITNDSSSHYKFAGPGFDGTELDPKIYLIRGKEYSFKHDASTLHPFQIQTTTGTVETDTNLLYTSGITGLDTNNRLVHGNTIQWVVPMDAPNTLYYYCRNHSDMNGTIKIIDDATGGMTSFTVAADSGSAQTITNGNTLSILGSTGIDTGAAATDTVSIAIDYSGADSFIMAAGNGTGINVEATDKLVVYDDDATAVKYINVSQMPISTMFVDEKTIANGASAHVNIESDLNSGKGGILTVKNDQAAASSSNPGSWGLTLDTDNLTADPDKVKYEILASDGKQFKVVASTTAIASYTGQSAISGGSSVTVTDSQKFILVYTGAAWKYSVQAI